MKKTFALVLCILIAPALVGSALAGDTPNSFTAMQSASSSLLPDAPQKRASSSQLAATLAFYSSRAAFDTVALGTPTEDFESGSAGPGAVIGCPNPLSTANTGACFPLGSLLPDFSYASSGGSAIVALGPGVVGNPSTAIAVDLFAQSGTLTFSGPNVFAVGFDFFEPFGTAVTISVFSADGLEGSTVIPVGGNFFGVTSDTPITAVEVGTAGANSAEVIDNLSFGDVCPCLASDPLFSDFVNGLVPIADYLECRDHEDNAGVLVVRTDGSIAGAASGSRGGQPPMCGTQVNNDPPNFITITPSQDATCRALLSAVCPD